MEKHLLTGKNYKLVNLGFAVYFTGFLLLVFLILHSYYLAVSLYLVFVFVAILLYNKAGETII